MSEDDELLKMLREEQLLSRELQIALENVIHTIENVRGSGGWAAVAKAISKARRLLNRCT